MLTYRSEPKENLLHKAQRSGVFYLSRIIASEFRFCMNNIAVSRVFTTLDRIKAARTQNRNDLGEFTAE